jgi:hypothetical protein
MALPPLAEALRCLPNEFWASQYALCPPSHAVRLRATSKLIRGLLDKLAVPIPAAVVARSSSTEPVGPPSITRQGNTSHKEAIQRGLRQAQAWATLVAVSLHGSLAEDTLLEAVRALDGVSTLKRLALCGHTVQREATAAAIASCVARQTCLARLDLGDTALSTQLRSLCKPLHKNNRVTSLRLANSRLDPSLLHPLKVFTCAQEVDLSHNRLFAVDLPMLPHFLLVLQRLKRIRRLVLDNTNMQDVDAFCLVHMMADMGVCPVLEVLSLQNNLLAGITSQDLPVLFNARPQMQVVDVRGNKLGKLGYESVRAFVNDGMVRCSYSELRMVRNTVCSGFKIPTLCDHGVRLRTVLETYFNVIGGGRDDAVFLRNGQRLTGEEVVGERIAGATHTLEGEPLVGDEVYLGCGDVEIQCVCKVSKTRT